MTIRLIRNFSVLLAAAAFTAGAHAEYRCDPAPTWVDRAACKAAEEGPDALRRFVQGMGWIRINIEFADYVDQRTAQNWETKRQMAERNEPVDAQKVASSEKR